MPKRAGPHTRAGTVAAGDHVYAHHQEMGPIPLRVLAHGRDGFTGEAEDGRRHRVPYDRLLGHRSRVKMDYKVVDAGADGAIVEDARGRRSFMAGDLSPPPDEAMAQPARRDPLLDDLDRLGKALAAGPVLLLKAGPLANRPGLALRDVTDRRGHQTKRWVRTMKDQPAPRRAAAGKERDEGIIHDPRQTDLEDFTGKPQQPIRHGDVIRFQHGQVEGQGKIVSSGRDGVTVRDDAGQTHQVRHDAIAGRAEGGEGGGGGALDADKLDSPDHRPSSIGLKDDGTFDAAAFASKHDKPDQAQVEAILSRFPADTAEKMAQIRERLAARTETQKLHKKDGSYSPERQELHNRIIGHYLSPERISAARPPEGQSPTFTILGGRGGSGKSWFNGKVYDPGAAIVLDADEIKHMLPEYEGWNAYEVHEESGDIFDAITQEAKDMGLNIVHDATMKTPAKAVKLVQGFKDDGYRIHAHYMHLPREMAAERAVGRFLGPTGRYVPVEVILGNTQNESAFDQVKALADKWTFHDNQGGKGSEPRLIAQGGRNEGDAEGQRGGAGATSAADRREDGRDGRAAAGRTARREGPSDPPDARAEGGPLRKAGGAAPVDGPVALLRRLVFWRR